MGSDFITYGGEISLRLREDRDRDRYESDLGRVMDV